MGSYVFYDSLFHHLNLFIIPILFLSIGLLMSVDAIFQDVVLRLPQFILQLNFLEGMLRFAVVVCFTFLFFGMFQVLHVRGNPAVACKKFEKSAVRWDGITSITILVMLNAVYVLFAVIQFKYLFSDGLQAGFTYAEYARRGFFELQLINWMILTCMLKFVQEKGKRLNQILKVMYALLIVGSGVMLASAYQRLSMYESAYGFTLDRMLAHALMIFLMVIFAYTFIRVRMERLAVLHFYMITGLLFYTALNTVNLEKIIVDKNLDRYEQTGKIDIYYLNTLSYAGWNGLIQLSEREKDYPELKVILTDRQQWLEQQPQSSWQSFNFTRQKVIEKMLGDSRLLR